ncbi:MAG: B12-binding domain-containing radical SAM protein [Magnetococcales bacterium]|nr:B12-binding domain-containing radical SAM protein [Magnetococcales bacterium]
MKDVLLIYPRLGSMDSMVVDLPLSLIYAAADSVKRGYLVEILDLRCESSDWRRIVTQRMTDRFRLVGISVMTGSPLHHAREISLFIREQWPNVPIVWGGPHVTVLPETLAETFIDFLVRGYGSLPLAELVTALREGRREPEEIKGISYKNTQGQLVHVPRCEHFERIHYRDIPYHLVDVASTRYQRFYKGARVFPLFTAVGCPYKCSFCVSPATYSVIKGKKWLADPDDDVIGHIRMLIERYQVTHLSIIDDTSFVDLKRMRRLFRRIIEEKMCLTLEFRGARINEIDKMDDEFLQLMVKAGCRMIMVGVETASDRILKQMQKGISREQILQVNRKLARYPQITPYFNFFYGSPGETYEDVVTTKDTVLQILRENPRAYFGVGGDWKPIPGTQMLAIAQEQYGFQAPRTMDEWVEMDSSDSKKKIVHPWYTSRHNNIIKMMQVASYVVDDKIIRESEGNKAIWFRMLRTLSRIYKPLAWFRLRHNFHYFMFEYTIYRLFVRIIPAIKQ